MPRPSLLLILLLWGLGTAETATRAAHWTPAQAQRLAQWLDAAPNEGLPAMSAQSAALRAAISGGNPAQLDARATTAALAMARALRLGVIPEGRRQGWTIAHDAGTTDFAAELEKALSDGTLDGFLGRMRPTHPFYGRLQRALVRSDDPAERAILRANLERWRWMPHRLGQRYIMANIAQFEVTLWDNGRPIGRWRAIVGKRSRPTPVFATNATGITFNPWWEIPSSIVPEIAALMRKAPTLAKRRGYFIDNGRYRQRPGAANSLGSMKMVMPNPHNVYLHDTPGKALLERDQRALSHGCVRVDHALDFARTLLADQADWPEARIQDTLESGKTTTAALATPVPVYITYFTAEPDDTDAVRFATDIYGKDKVLIGQLAR